MSETNRFVERRTPADIAQLALNFRAAFQLGQDRVGMAPLLELALPEVLPHYEFRVVDDAEMPGVEGLTDLHDPVIRLPASVYEALLAGCTRARFTAAHELGHLLMHSNSRVHYARAEYHDQQVDPEWQANQFAAVFLMPEQAFRSCGTVEEAMQRFGVGYFAASKRARELKHKFKKKGRKLMARTP